MTAYLRFFFFLFLGSSNIAFPCTRLLKSFDDGTVIVGRTMDWSDDMHTNLWVYPRGEKRYGFAFHNSLEWVSKYGSVVATVFDLMTTDGINEKGLGVHILWLDEANFGKRNVSLKGMSVVLWAQFFLDNFQSVHDAIKYISENPFQLEPFFNPITQENINVHLVLEDAKGESAVFEYVNGELNTYRGPQYNVVTNSPTFDKQLNNLQQYVDFGGIKPLPGTTSSMDRFVRASYYVNHLSPDIDRNQDKLTQVRSVIENIAEPFGKSPQEGTTIEPTIWRTITDLTNRIYYFNSSRSLNFIWTDLNKLNFEPNAPIMKLDLTLNPNLVGDVSNQYQEYL